MRSSLLESLNEKQRTAIEKPLQPVLVLAGPGTGKTRMIIARVELLLSKYFFQPEKILALTFTNKAANEMKTRLLNKCGQNAIDVKTSTIHAFALEIIKNYHHLVGLKKNFSVCDREYQNRLMKKLCSPVIKDDVDNKIRALLLSISNHQMRDTKLAPFAAEKYEEYITHLTKNNLIDFNQILVLCKKLFVKQTNVLQEYQHLYPAILVDEFQDTDPVQYEIIKLLAEKEKNIFVVADDDQSIYSWRGANPENIQKFIKDFDIDAVDFLDINYRSGKHITESAYSIIKDTDRIEPNKKIKSLPDMSDDIKIYLFLNESAEIEFILKVIKNWIENGVALNEIAVIYPYHKIGSSLEHYFLRSQINYQMATGNSILENPLMQRLMMYLRVIHNTTDDISLEQLSEIDIGMQITKLIKNYGLKKNITFRKSLYDFYRLKKGEIDFSSMMLIKNFISQIANLVNLKTFYTLNQLIDEIFRQSYRNSISFLNNKINELEKPPDLSEFKSIFHNDKNEFNYFVLHPDPRIEFIAITLISSILENKVYSFSEYHQKTNSSNNIVFALDPLDKEIKSALIIPVYSFKNSKRKGVISNLFKVMQTLFSSQSDALPDTYVILDLETTDKEVSSCGIVEIAAVRVSKGKIIDELQSLINPEMKISKGAEAVHHISESDVASAPTLEKYWPKFLKFIGNDLLIAHNGYAFDFAILDRFSRKISGERLLNIKLDSLTMARNLFTNQSNSIDALAEKFQLDTGVRHRALDDVKVLHEIVKIFQSMKGETFQKTSFEIFTDVVALGNYIEKNITAVEDKIYFLSGIKKLISPYDTTLDLYCKKFDLDKMELLQELKNVYKKFDVSFQHYNQDENILFKIKLLANEFNQLEIDEAIAMLINSLNLTSGGQDNLEDINAVSLLTFHAAKGLEFEKVILMGLEKNNIPGYHALREDEDDGRSINKKIEEQRRLLYVGITRGKSEVLMTAVKNRGGWENESSPFLKDLNIPKVVIEN